MDKKFKECMKPHSLMHSLAGLGVGLILVGFFPVAGVSAFMFGLLVLVAAIAGDFMVNK